MKTSMKNALGAVCAWSLAVAAPAQQALSVSPQINYLTVNRGSTWMPAGSELLIFSNNVFAPGDPRFNFLPMLLPYTNPNPPVFWGVIFNPAPFTLYNTTAIPIHVLWNVYSDNSYTYQGRATVAPLSYSTLSFGTMQLGYIYGPNPPGSVGPGSVGPLLPEGAGMSLVVGITASNEGLIGFWDPYGPTPYYPGFGRVSGGSVTLTPLCQQVDCN
jgi:hypothetical protein